MTLTKIFLSLSITALLSGVGFLYNKVSQLQSSLSSLQSKNIDLKKKNKSLVSKQTEIKNKIAQNRINSQKSKFKRIQKRLAKSGIGAIPLIGTATAVGFAYDDIKTSCEDIKSMKEFEKSLFPNSEIETSDEEKVLCGYDIAAVKKIILDN